MVGGANTPLIFSLPPQANPFSVDAEAPDSRSFPPPKFGVPCSQVNSSVRFNRPTQVFCANSPPRHLFPPSPLRLFLRPVNQRLLLAARISLQGSPIRLKFRSSSMPFPSFQLTGSLVTAVLPASLSVWSELSLSLLAIGLLPLAVRNFVLVHQSFQFFLSQAFSAAGDISLNPPFSSARIMSSMSHLRSVFHRSFGLAP